MNLADQLDALRTHLCGFDLNFSYPETNGPFPALSYPTPSDPLSPYNVNTASLMRDKMLRVVSSESLKTLEQFSKRGHSKDLQKRDIVREEKRQQWKRDLSGRANGTLDSWYACFLLTEIYGKATAQHGRKDTHVRWSRLHD